MPLHHFCNFNFNTCETLYNGFVLIKTCKYYTLLSTCILWLLMILILPFVTYIKMHIFNLCSLLIRILLMFVLPHVVSASIAGVQFIAVVLCVTHFYTELTETLKILLSQKSYFVFFMTYNTYIASINIYSYMLIC